MHFFVRIHYIYFAFVYRVVVSFVLVEIRFGFDAIIFMLQDSPYFSYYYFFCCCVCDCHYVQKTEFDILCFHCISMQLPLARMCTSLSYSFRMRVFYARFLLVQRFFTLPVFFCSECAFARTIESVHAFGWHFTCSALVYKSSPMYAYTHTNADWVCINIQRYVTIGQYKTRSNRHHTHSLNDFRTINQNKNE